MYRLISVVLFVLGLAASAGAVEGRFAWAPATGPVTGYEIELAKNGGAFVPVGTVTAGTSAPVQSPSFELGQPGDTIQVRVRATGAAGKKGSFSEPSDVVTILDPTPLGQPGKPIVIILQVQ